MINVIFHRLSAAISILPNIEACLYAIFLLLLYTIIALPIGFQGKFLQIEVVRASWQTLIGIITISFLTQRTQRFTQRNAKVFGARSELEEKWTAAFFRDRHDFLCNSFREADNFHAIHKHNIKVGYVYKKLAFDPDSTQTETLALIQEALATLPADGLASLHPARIEGDLELMLTLGDRHEPAKRSYC